MRWKKKLMKRRRKGKQHGAKERNYIIVLIILTMRWDK